MLAALDRISTGLDHIYLKLFKTKELTEADHRLLSIFRRDPHSSQAPSKDRPRRSESCQSQLICLPAPRGRAGPCWVLHFSHGGSVSQEWSSRSYWVDLKWNQAAVAAVCTWSKAELIPPCQSPCGAHGRPAEQSRAGHTAFTSAWLGICKQKKWSQHST